MSNPALINAKIVNKVSEIEEASQLDGYFVGILRSTTTYLLRKKLKKSLLITNTRLVEVLAVVEERSKDVSFPKNIYNDVLHLIEMVKSMKSRNEVIFYYNRSLNNLQEINIGIAYQIENIVRSNVYSKNNSEPSEETKRHSRRSMMNLSGRI